MTSEKKTIQKGREIAVNRLMEFFKSNNHSVELHALDNLKGELSWNGKTYKIKTCDTLALSRIVVEYSTDTYSDKTLDFDGYIFIDRNIEYQDRFFVVGRAEIFKYIDANLGRSSYVKMTEMTQDILENNGLCISCCIPVLMRNNLIEQIRF